MSFHRALAPLLVLLLTACPGSSSPPDGGTPPQDSGSASDDAGTLALSVTTESLPAAAVSVAYRATLAASGGVSPYTWHVVSGELPSGLSLSTAGELAGTPATGGSASFTVEVQDARGRKATRALSLEVLSGLDIAPKSLPDAYVGSAYPVTLSAAGGSAPYTWVLAEGTLPGGLRLGAEGQLSGSPVSPGTFSFTVGVQDAAGHSARKSLTVSVFLPPALSSAALPRGVVGASYSAPLSVSGGREPLSFHVTSGALPPGLQLEGTSIAGIPTASGVASFTVEARDANDRTASAALEIDIRGELTVTSSGLPDAYTDTPYSQALTAAGGRPPYTWKLQPDPSLPGMRFLDSGVVDGTPSAPGSSSVNACVTDDAGDTACQALPLRAYAPPQLAAVPPQVAYVGDPIQVSLSASAGKPPLTFSSGPRPPGLTFATEGRLEGSLSQAGETSVDVSVRDANGRTASRSVAFTVHALPALTTTALPEGDVNVPYTTARLSSSGGRGTSTFARISGSLPPGVTLQADGAFTGTPSASGTFSFTAQVTDEGGRTSSRTLSIVVAAPLVITTTTLDDGYVGSAPTGALTSSGGHGTSRTWTVTAGSLPSGLLLNPNTGALSGIPSTAGTASFTARVTDGVTSATQNLALTVYRLPSVSAPAVLPDAYASEPYLRTLTAADGKPPTTFSFSGTLPSGLRLSSDGILSGTPSTAGESSSFTVIVTDANGRTGSRAYAVPVFALPSVTTASLPEARAGQGYSTSLAASGGKGTLTWSRTGALPEGLALSASGVISGTPTGGTTTFTATATDANGRAASRDLTLPVLFPPRVTTVSLPDATVGQFYSVTLTASGGRPSLSWSYSGALPTGLWLSSDGVLSGTPTSGGTASFTVTVRDADDNSDSRVLSLQVVADSAMLTVGHWNLTWFGAPNQGPPRSTSDGGTPDDLQIAYARDVIADAGVNVWGLVEMVDTTDFNTLKAQLPGYSGFLANNTAYVTSGASSYSNGEQKPGILYDSSLTFRTAQVILTSSAADFGGRPPLRVDFTTRMHGTDGTLVVIVVHMKAFEDPTSYQQRQNAGLALKNYLDNVLPSERVLIIGDWNDDVDHSISQDGLGNPLTTPYANFVEDSAHYTFITQALSLSNQRTTVNYNDVIDHTLATDEVAFDYVPNSVRVLRPDAWIPDYGGVVSDHYPVLSRYDFSGPGGPGVRLLAPQGGTYISGNSLDITWRVLGVSTVRLEVSYDGGGHWSLIAPSVSASLGTYAWTVPDVESSAVLVRVVDTTNVSRFDTNDSPLAFTRTPPRVFINEVLPNEPSLDGGVGDVAYEFIEVVNAGPTAADISGWTLSDLTASRHVFAPGTLLAPGRAFVVYGGASAFPPGTPNTVACSTGLLGLNNGGDTVRLKFPDGGVSDEMAYGSTVDNVSFNRSPDANPDGGFVLHTTLPPGLTSSAGRHADGGAF